MTAVKALVVGWGSFCEGGVARVLQPVAVQGKGDVRQVGSECAVHASVWFQKIGGFRLATAESLVKDEEWLEGAHTCQGQGVF